MEFPAAKMGLLYALIIGYLKAIFENASTLNFDSYKRKENVQPPEPRFWPGMFVTYHGKRAMVDRIVDSGLG